MEFHRNKYDGVSKLTEYFLYQTVRTSLQKIRTAPAISQLYHLRADLLMELLLVCAKFLFSSIALTPSVVITTRFMVPSLL